VPVVPVVIRGSRDVLPSGVRLPRRARLEVIVRRPIAPQGTTPEAIAHVREASRHAILELLDEPDLTAAAA
jgi:1-acyl-sn-glycerol-3-phosphate acyltransferase